MTAKSPDFPTSHEQLVKTAREALDHWSSFTMNKRVEIFKGFLDFLEENRTEISKITWDEMSKPPLLADSETSAAIRYGRFVIDLARKDYSYQAESTNPNKEMIVTRVPFGVVLAITSFNTPLPNFMWKVAPSLLNGNVVILKPSPYNQRVAAKFCEYWYRIFGTETSPVQLCLEPSDYVEALIPEVDAVSFTGSTFTGRKILSIAASKNLPVIAELGGSNPLIVDETADLYRAAKAAVQSAFSNGGQRCAAGSRLYVHKRVYSEFLELFKEETRHWLTLDLQHSEYAPLVPSNRVTSFQEAIVKLKYGARSSTDFEVPAWAAHLPGAVPPILLEFDSNPNTSLELFGPIAILQPFESVKTAVECANSSDFALTAAFWSSNSDHIDFVSRNIRAGLLNINGPTMGAEPTIPFGGFGASGNGTRETGRESMYQYSTSRVITRTYFGEA